MAGMEKTLAMALARLKASTEPDMDYCQSCGFRIFEVEGGLAVDDAEELDLEVTPEEVAAAYEDGVLSSRCGDGWKHERGHVAQWEIVAATKDLLALAGEPPDVSAELETLVRLEKDGWAGTRTELFAAAAELGSTK
jgi:hypothetical protein